MATDSDKKSFGKKVGAIVAGVVAGGLAGAHYVTQAAKTNIFHARIIKQDVNLENIGVPPPGVLEDTAHLHEVRTALEDADSVLGRAHINVMANEENKALFEDIAGFPGRIRKYKNTIANVLTDAANEYSTGNGSTQNIDALNKLKHEYPRYLGAEEKMAGLAAHEIPLLEKMKLKNLHLNGEQKLSAGLMFASVAAITGYAMHSLTSWLGKGESTSVLPPEDITR